MQDAAQTRRRWQALLAIAIFALLPPLVLVLPAPVPAGTVAPQRLIVWLPQQQAGDLAGAAPMLDAADARPLDESRLAGLWLVSVRGADAANRLYAAGARLVLSGDGLLAGCLFRSAS
jgi:hypothetical protein